MNVHVREWYSEIEQLVDLVMGEINSGHTCTSYLRQITKSKSTVNYFSSLGKGQFSVEQIELFYFD